MISVIVPIHNSQLYLKSYLMDTGVPVKSKCKTLARILKRITER